MYAILLLLLIWTHFFIKRITSLFYVFPNVYLDLLILCAVIVKITDMAMHSK